jgi:DNA-binding NtrC family response regulator
MKILIVDDEAPVREFLKKGITKLTGFSAEVAQDGSDAIRKIEADLFDLVLTDMKMPVLDGIDLLKTIKEMEPEIRVIVMTGYGTIKTAVEAMKNGADDFITKPIDLDELFLRLSKVEKEMTLLRENRLLKQEARKRSGFDFIVGKSKRMQEVFSLIEKVAPSNSTVVICGSSGTGKELVAKAIHDHSPRADKPFVPFNCGAIPEPLVESEFFGHKKGAFTGAIQAKRGLFEEANGGTLFLDEITTLPLSVQVKLLRFLQEREFMRVGDTQRMKVDLRIIAATNENLEDNVRKGTFREDLFYRLYVFPISLPDLTDRREDIPLLSYHFLKLYAEKNQKRIKGISQEAMKILLEHDWPGNVRELENAVCRATLMTDKEYLVPDDLPRNLGIGSSDIIQRGLRERRSLDEMKAEYIRETLKEVGGNRKLAAEILKVHFKTLYRFDKELKSI